MSTIVILNNEEKPKKILVLNHINLILMLI